MGAQPLSSHAPVVSIEFPATWQAKILAGEPLIKPARSFVLPQAVPGEEDAMARGALWLQVRPRVGGTFLVQCALGFASGNVLHGIWATPDPDVLLAAAGGYAYGIDTVAPEHSTLLPLRPVIGAHAVHEPAALVLVGFHAAYILQAGADWLSPRLSWEGVTVTGSTNGMLHGTGWHMPSDRELPFSLNLHTRELTGGGFLP